MVIFFDIDDTLITHSDAVRSAVTTLHARLGLSGTVDAFASRWQGAHHHHYPRFLTGELSYPELRRLRVRETIDATLDDAEADQIFEAYMAAYQSAWTLFPDVRPCLDQLRSHTLGIISNGPSDEQRRKLQVTGVDQYFQHVVISQDFGVPKPDPQIFLHACQMAAVAPRNAVYVGDHYEGDVKGANDAGLGAIWLNRRSEARAVRHVTIATSLLHVPRCVDAVKTHS